jgi:hypothetical protein
MTTSPAYRTGLIAFAVAALFDGLQLTSMLTVDDAPPFVAWATAVFGILTLAGVAAAWRGNRTGLLIAVVARVCDSLILGVPAFFLPAPWYARAIVIVTMVLGILGIWLVAPALRRATPRVA